MPKISASQVASLRARTGVSILECKSALEESGGDEEKAINILRKKGASQAAKKASRDQFEGSIFMREEKGKVALLFLRCETDFVASNKDFMELGNELVSILFDSGEDTLKNAATEKTQAAVAKLGENISIGESALVEGDIVGSYLHSNSRIGVAVSLSGGSSDLAREVAMHAAAMNPDFISPDEVSESNIEIERNIWKEQLAKEGKPAQIIEKIMSGKEKKYREENALVTQNFVKDPSKTVQQHIGDANITKYVRLAVS